MLAVLTILTTEVRAESPPSATVIDVGVRAAIDDAQWCTDTLMSWKVKDKPKFGFFDVVDGRLDPLIDHNLSKDASYHCTSTALFAITSKELVKYRLDSHKVEYRVPLGDFTRAMRDGDAKHRKELGVAEEPDACQIDVIIDDGQNEVPRPILSDPDVCLIRNANDFFCGGQSAR